MPADHQAAETHLERRFIMNTQTHTAVEQPSSQKPLSIGHELLLRNKILLMDVLAAAGVEAVVISYEGQGDSGDMSSVEPYFLAPDEDMSQQARLEATSVETWCPENPPWEKFTKAEDLKKKSVLLMDALKDFAFHTLEVHCPGWEVNQGSSGQVTLVLEDKHVLLEHVGKRSDEFAVTFA